MRLHRFYVDKAISGNTFDITDRELVHQWKNVFRYNVGSQVILFDGLGFDYLCIISSQRNLGATVGVIQKTKMDSSPKLKLTLCIGLTKKDNFELVVQKATELGVTNIIPVLCERSEKKNINLDRVKKIAIEAAEQSGRGSVPTVYGLIKFVDLLNSDLLPNRVISLDASASSLDSVKKETPKELAVFIGPEGGWSESELKEFTKHNISSYSLGEQILRAETAAIAVSTLLLL